MKGDILLGTCCDWYVIHGILGYVRCGSIALLELRGPALRGVDEAVRDVRVVFSDGAAARYGDTTKRLFTNIQEMREQSASRHTTRKPQRPSNGC